MNAKKKSSLGSIIGVIVLVAFVCLTVFAFIKDNQSSETIEEVSYTKLQEIIKRKEKSIILIGRDNCSHCVSYKPTIEDVAKMYEIKVYYINTNTIERSSQEYKDLWDFFDCDGTPTTAIVSNGELVAREEGEITRSKLVAFLKANYF